ncbi:hypothetical protein Tco_0842548 [Tanacetum coccineum]|uniref:Uncharacterized protein n=1 Tax=Tanacetum coccineum TaxID=301880 RepID=A0ABQ5B3Q9_9ASTR
MSKITLEYRVEDDEEFLGDSQHTEWNKVQFKVDLAKMLDILFNRRRGKIIICCHSKAVMQRDQDHTQGSIEDYMILLPHQRHTGKLYTAAHIERYSFVDRMLKDEKRAKRVEVDA